MSKFDKNDERDKDNDKGGSAIPILIVLGILMLPALIIGTGIYWGMLRIGRQRLSVIAVVSSLMSLIAITYGALSSAFEKSVFVFVNIMEFRENWQLLIPAAVVINVVVGSIIGFVLVLTTIGSMKANPHRFKLEGNWMYGFEFRRTPLQYLRRKKNIEGLKSGKFVHDKKAPLGFDEEHNDSLVYRYGSEAIKQTIISGSAGSGKTITMLSLIRNDIIAGLPIIVIDFKRSPELATKISTWSKEEGRNFYHFVNGDPEKYDVPHSPGQATYEPLINGGASKADMVLGMREYDTAAEVYKSSMRQLLQVLFSMLRYADRSKAPKIDWDHGSIYQVQSAVNGNITELASACENTPIQEDAEAIDLQSRSRGSNLRHAMDELQGQMRTIIASEYGRWLKLTKGIRNIDLYKLTENADEGNVILFSLNSDSEKDFSKYLGSLIFADLNSVSALRRNSGNKNQVNIYVDEFQAVPPTAVTSLLEKSRESRLGMTLSSQSYEQIISASASNGEAYLLGILDTCSNFIVHSGATEDSAIRLSKIIGKDMFTAYGQTNVNKSSMFSFNFANRRNQDVRKTEEERWIVHPKKFMSLSSPTVNNGFKSTAVIINKSTDDPAYKDHGGALARTVWMIPNNRVIDDYYMPKLESATDEIQEPILGEAENAFEYQDAPMDLLSENETFEDYEYDSAGTGHEDEDGDFEWESTEDDPYLQEASTISVSERVSENVSEDYDIDDLPMVDFDVPVEKNAGRKTNGSGIPVRAVSGLKTREAVDTPNVAESVSNRPQRSAVARSGFDSMFSGDVKPKSLKEIKASEVKPELEDEFDLPDLEDLL